ncbi:hypothetical protein EX30DRAFT_340133 [Ascodesmis nigricans]|uniref:Uncharacterized protein n=1 Tax=Ascodesmis nigricans TaxID=341454 RepID=A0A4S2MZK5_9PEZI|nr:hypothetical protein EX30DRAFT_340133 [Ascodesmis nigricans]
MLKPTSPLYHHPTPTNPYPHHYPTFPSTSSASTPPPPPPVHLTTPPRKPVTHVCKMCSVSTVPTSIIRRRHPGLGNTTVANCRGQGKARVYGLWISYLFI